jgi:hypothetical protein
MGPDADLMTGFDDEPERYPTRPVRPATRIALRAGLWTAVGLGALGGIVGLVRSPEAPTVEGPPDERIVPAPVAGMAETVVEAWLPATDDDQEELEPLFVDPPELPSEDDQRDLEVRQVRTIAGQRLEEGYWTVTVAARVVETVAEEEGGPRQPREATWYVEVGIVGLPKAGLAALTTPAVVPRPPAVETGWQLTTASPSEPEDGSPVVATVEGFLNALLAGQGDPSRYLAPRVPMQAANPPPFTEVRVDLIAIEELEEGTIRIWTQLEATTPGGSVQIVAYELTARERVDRWEILQAWGAPTVQGSPTPPEEPEDSTGSSTSETTETTEDGGAGDPTVAGDEGTSATEGGEGATEPTDSTEPSESDSTEPGGGTGDPAVDGQ